MQEPVLSYVRHSLLQIPQSTSSIVSTTSSTYFVNSNLWTASHPGILPQPISVQVLFQDPAITRPFSPPNVPQSAHGAGRSRHFPRRIVLPTFSVYYPKLAISLHFLQLFQSIWFVITNFLKQLPETLNFIFERQALNFSQIRGVRRFRACVAVVRIQHMPCKVPEDSWISIRQIFRFPILSIVIR